MFPHTIKIRGHVYEVRQIAGSEMPSDASASIDNELNTLRLQEPLAPSREIEAVFHELIHALLEGYGYEDEEAIAVTLGEALTEFVGANPDFIKYALTILSR